MDCKDDYALCEEILQSIEAGDFKLIEAPEGFEQRVMIQIHALEEYCPKTFKLSAFVPDDFLENVIYIAWCIVSILLSAVLIVTLNQEQIISYFNGNPRLEQYAEFLQNVAQYLEGLVLSLITFFNSLLEQTVLLLSGYRYFFLIIFAVLAMVQFFMHKKNIIGNKIQV